MDEGNLYELVADEWKDRADLPHASYIGGHGKLVLLNDDRHHIYWRILQLRNKKENLKYGL